MTRSLRLIDTDAVDVKLTGSDWSTQTAVKFDLRSIRASEITAAIYLAEPLAIDPFVGR